MEDYEIMYFEIVPLNILILRPLSTILMYNSNKSAELFSVSMSRIFKLNI